MPRLRRVDKRRRAPIGFSSFILWHTPFPHSAVSNEQLERTHRVPTCMYGCLCLYLNIKILLLYGYFSLVYTQFNPKCVIDSYILPHYIESIYLVFSKIVTLCRSFSPMQHSSIDRDIDRAIV